MIDIDLLPPDEARAAAAARRLRVVSVRGAAAVAVALVLGHVALERIVVDTRRALVRTDVERSALERPVRALRRLRQRQATLRRRLAVIERLEARGREPVVLLGALATAAPARLWLTELTLVDGRLRLAGLAADERIIADFIARLRGVGILGAIDLEEAGRDDRATPSPRRFVIGGRLGAAR